MDVTVGVAVGVVGVVEVVVGVWLVASIVEQAIAEIANVTTVNNTITGLVQCIFITFLICIVLALHLI